MPKKKTEDKTSTPEVRFGITPKLDEILERIAEEFGVAKSDYVRSLILNDLRSKENA